MVQVRRNEFEIDLRVHGFEAATRKHLMRAIEEVTVLRQDLATAAQLIDGLMDVLKQVTEVGAANVTEIINFRKRLGVNDAIHNDKDK